MGPGKGSIRSAGAAASRDWEGAVLIHLTSKEQCRELSLGWECLLKRSLCLLDTPLGLNLFASKFQPFTLNTFVLIRCPQYWSSTISLGLKRLREVCSESVWSEHLKAWRLFLSIRSGVDRMEGKAALSFLSSLGGTPTMGWGRLDYQMEL